MSNYPNALDTDLEIPRVDAEITEIDGDTINALRDAIFAIQRTLGLSLQGAKANLSDRLNVSIDSQGRVKRAALEGIGLVTLPITNNQVASNASIQEAKLDLDHTTQSLKNSLNSAEIDIDGLQAAVASLGAQFSLHVVGQSSNHDGYQIKINATNPSARVAGLSATTIGDAVNELSQIFFVGVPPRPPHIDFSLPDDIKHVAENISVDSTNFTTIDPASENVQEALESVDAEVLGQQAGHLDGFHADGILKSINSGDDFNPEQQHISSKDVSYTEGGSVVTFSSLSGSFASLGIQRGDIIDIESGLDAGTHQIIDVGPMTSGETLGARPALSSTQLRIAHVFSETNTAVASVYGPASISSESAPLASAVRQLGTPVDSVAIVNPDAARVVSLGFNGSILNDIPDIADGYTLGLEIGLGNGVYRSITIPNLHFEGASSGKAQPVSARSVAERINAYVSDPDENRHFPVTAAQVGNEIVIAHNLVGPEYTLEILDGYTGNFALGLDEFGANVLGEVLNGNSNNLYSVNGVTRSTLATKLSGTASITSDSQTFVINVSGSPINPVSYGIVAGDIMHITGHPTSDINGSYVLENVGTSSVTVYSTEEIPAPVSPTTFNVLFTHSNVSLEAIGGPEDDKGLMQISVDESGRTVAHQRLTYGASPGLGTAVDVLNVSRGFPIGTFTLNISEPSATPDIRAFNIIEGSVSGTTVNIDEDFKGSFKLYHPNNIDFLLVRVGPGTVSSSSTTFTINPILNDDERLEICSVHFDGDTALTSLVDTRQFGTLGADQIRDDFIEIFSQKPVEDLRSNGVARGFDLLSMPLVDTLTDMQALPLSGGTAYVRGARVVVETQKIIVPSFDDSGNLITNQVFIVGINEFGSIRAFEDELGEILSDGYNSSATFGKVLPLFEVTVSSGVISRVVDVRRFINDIDEKIELIVDESNNVVGNFRTLEGALLYAQKFPGAEKLTIKITNSAFPSREITVPNGVSLLGAVPYGGERHRIVNENDLNTNFITLEGNNRIENLQIESDTIQVDAPLLFVDGDNINIEKCLITFTDSASISSNSEDLGIRIGTNATDNIRIVNNRIDKAFSGIEGTFGVDNIVIRDNEILNVSGTSTEASGIKLGSSARGIANADISGNRIKVPNATLSTIRGVFIDVDNTIDVLRVENNNVLHDESTQNTMVDGIRVENVSASGNKVENLFVTNNLVLGIKLDDNDVFGIYVADTERAKIDNNMLRQIGNAGNNDNACIRIDEDVDFAAVTNNLMEDCAVNVGISVTDTTQCNILNNRLESLDEDAIYIDGNGIRSKIHGNLLTGSGTTGIRWTGEKSTITSNTLNANSSYSFSDYGIFTLADDVDVTANTITDMTATSGTRIGISTGGSSRNRVRISDNTVDGSSITKLIELLGDDHMVSGNRLRNTTNSSTDFISIDGDNMSITDNLLQGVGDNGLAGVGTITSNTISGNTVTASVGQGINASGAETCVVEGNHLPDVTNTVGPTATSSTTNDNLIGINRGMLDTIGITLGEGVSSYSKDTDDIYSHPHWFLDGDRSGAFQAWLCSTEIGSPAGDRRLFLPLSKLPNGARLVSASISGNNAGGGSLTIQVVRRAHDDQTTADGVSLSSTNSISSGTFDGGTTTTGLVNLSSETVVNHAAFNYYLVIRSSGSLTTEPRVTSARAVIRY